MRAVAVSPDAERDIDRASAWYARRRQDLDDEFLAAVEAALSGLASGPERFRAVYRDLRRAPIERFPHALTFRIVGRAVRVVACTHDRGHPRRWQNRR